MCMLSEDRIPTYVINLKHRTDRKTHILNEFSGYNEFDVKLIEACEHTTGTIGLWNSIKCVLEEAKSKNQEYILICEDDHCFTEDYSKDVLLECIKEAKNNNADILSGGSSWFTTALKISKNLFWQELFTGTQFVIIFEKFFDAVLEADFTAADSADFKFSSLTDNILLIYPFVSVQKEFGYSDITESNNREGFVESSFKRSSAKVKIIDNLSKYYEINEEEVLSHQADDLYEDVSISTYIINLPERVERRKHIVDQFHGKTEFDIRIIDAERHEIGAVGLWENIRTIVQEAVKNDEDVIIICEDDHEFSKHYSKEILFRNIYQAFEEEVDYLSGGTGSFDIAVPMSKDRFWIHPCFSSQFIVVFKRFFSRIIDYKYDDHVIADMILSKLTHNKMVLYPFISSQKDFGYSDVTPAHNEEKGYVDSLFARTNLRFKKIEERRSYFSSLKQEAKS